MIDLDPDLVPKNPGPGAHVCVVTMVRAVIAIPNLIDKKQNSGAKFERQDCGRR